MRTSCMTVGRSLPPVPPSSTLTRCVGNCVWGGVRDGTHARTHARVRARVHTACGVFWCYRLRHQLDLTFQHIAYLPMKVNTMVSNASSPIQAASDVAEAAAEAALKGIRPAQKYRDEPMYDVVKELADLSGRLVVSAG